jgi:integrator complex subunit 2
MIVTPRAFNAVQNLNINELLKCAEKEIRPFLLSLVRSVLIENIDRKELLVILVNSEVVNNIVALLQVNYIELESDVKKEQQLR